MSDILESLEQFAQHGELVIGVIGGFLLAALVLVLQKPTGFMNKAEGLGHSYVGGLVLIIAVGVISSVFASTVWSFVASEKHSGAVKFFGLAMTSLTLAMIAFAIPMMVIPFDWQIGITIAIFEVVAYAVCFVLLERESPENVEGNQTHLDPRDTS